MIATIIQHQYCSASDRIELVRHSLGAKMVFGRLVSQRYGVPDLGIMTKFMLGWWVVVFTAPNIGQFGVQDSHDDPTHA